MIIKMHSSYKVLTVSVFSPSLRLSSGSRYMCDPFLFLFFFTPSGRFYDSAYLIFSFINLFSKPVVFVRLISFCFSFLMVGRLKIKGDLFLQGRENCQERWQRAVRCYHPSTTKKERTGESDF